MIFLGRVAEQFRAHNCIQEMKRGHLCICVCAQSLSHIQPFVTIWTVALQAPLSMDVSRQEYWSGLPFPPPGGLSEPGIEPVSLASSALAGIFFIISVFKTRSTCQVCNADSLKE